jgi:hypothetical protein
VNTPVKGQKYLWRGVRIEVTRVNADGLWADIRCFVPAVPPSPGDVMGRQENSWTKRQPTPHGKFPDDWEPVSEPAPELPAT